MAGADRFAAYVPSVAQLAEIAGVRLRSKSSVGAVWLADVADEASELLATFLADSTWPSLSRLMLVAPLFVPLDEDLCWRIYADLQVWRLQDDSEMLQTARRVQSARTALTGVAFSVLGWLTAATLHLFDADSDSDGDDGTPPVDAESAS